MGEEERREQDATRQAGEVAETDVPNVAEEPLPFVRPRAPHKTQAAIDDLGQDSGGVQGYAHDSNVAVGSMPFTDGGYRRSRSSMDQLKGSRYGQYLEIPKGRRSIFSSRGQEKRRGSTLGGAAAVIVLAALAFVVLRLTGVI